MLTFTGSISRSRKSGESQSSSSPPIGVMSRSWEPVPVGDVDEGDELEFGEIIVDEDAVASRAASMRRRRSGGVPGCAG